MNTNFNLPNSHVVLVFERHPLSKAVLNAEDRQMYESWTDPGNLAHIFRIFWCMSQTLMNLKKENVNMMCN